MQAEVRIERYADQGRCVAHIDGRVVFVRFALPDELVRVELDEPHDRDDRFWTGEVVEVLEPSEDRATPAWPLAGPLAMGGGVGGADLVHVSLPGQLKWKAITVSEQMSRLGHIDVAVPIERMPGDKEAGGLNWRTRIEMIASFFAEGEVDEIWITFPDPQLKSRRAKKRLTSPLFLGQYAQMQVPGGRINLKTDSQHLYAYTQAVIERFGLPCDVANNDIYGSGFADEILSVKTAYEQMFLERKLPITYTRFSLGERRDFPPFDWEGDDTDEKDNEEARKNRNAMP